MPVRTLKAFAQQIAVEKRAGYAPSTEALAVVEFAALVEACLYTAIQHGYERRAKERDENSRLRKTRRRADASRK